MNNDQVCNSRLGLWYTSDDKPNVFTQFPFMSSDIFTP